MQRLIFISALILACCFFARAQKIEIPFELIEERIYIRLPVNGGDSLNFIFDTGCALTIVDENLIAQTGLHGETANPYLIEGNGGNIEPRFFPGQELGLPHAPLKIDIACVPLNKMREKYNRDIQGLIGSDICKNFVVEINYADQFLILSDEVSEVAGLHLYHHVKIAEKFRGIFAIRSNFKVLGQKFAGLLLFDTGAADVRFYNPVRKKVKLASSDELYVTIMYGISQQKTTQVACRADQLVLCDSLFPGFPVTLKSDQPSFGELGDLGNNILKRFDLIIDYRKGNVYFRPNQHFYSDFGINKSALELIYTPDFEYITIDNVIRPHWRQGALVGDTLETINRLPVNKMTIIEARKIMNESTDTVELGLRRDSLKIVRYLPQEVM